MGQYDQTTDDRGSGDLHAAQDGSRQASEIHRLELTVAERYIISRRRSGLTQSQAAESLGIHRNTYMRLERGEEIELGTVCPDIENIQPHEYLLIKRLRKDWTLEQAASAIGLSRPWYNKIELGQVRDHRAMEYWNAR